MSTDGMKRVAKAVKIMADDTVLQSVLVFKGQPNGRIAKKEFATYPTTAKYSCQPNACRVVCPW